jgi:hypothetical protein
MSPAMVLSSPPSYPSPSNTSSSSSYVVPDRTLPSSKQNNTSHTSRSVAHLSASKLERKRAIDRASQRVLRQRNKARLSDLEEENRRLRETLAAKERREEEATRRLTPGSSVPLSRRGSDIRPGWDDGRRDVDGYAVGYGKSVEGREMSIQSTTHSVWHNGGWVTFDFDTSPQGCKSSSPCAPAHDFPS